MNNSPTGKIYMCEYEIFYHYDKKLCIVSNSKLANNLKCSLQEFDAVQISTETIDEFDKNWVDQYSFIVLTSDVSLKQKAVEKLKLLNANFFSAVNKNNRIGYNTEIGVGTWIDCYNQSLPLDKVEIKNHCIVSSFNLFGHGSFIEDFCHISAHGFFSHCTIGQGSVIGARSSVFGDSQQRIKIAPYTNLLAGSAVSKIIDRPGTYSGNRRCSDDTSLVKRIL
jgi:acetyltransferase-like isoleucine patch superfamily enzyme